MPELQVLYELLVWTSTSVGSVMGFVCSRFSMSDCQGVPSPGSPVVQSLGLKTLRRRMSPVNIGQVKVPK